MRVTSAAPVRQRPQTSTGAGMPALVMHSDGVSARWSLERYPGLAVRDPSLVAGVLYRDFCRGSDDATVVAVREAAVFA